MASKTANRKSLITLGDVVVFASVCVGIYFVFLRGNKSFAQTFDGTSGDNKISDPKYDDRRKKFFSNSNPNPSNFIRGYEMPDKIEGLNFIKGYVYMISKPDEKDVFGGLPPKTIFRVKKSGKNLVYNGSVNGNQGQFKESFKEIKDRVVITNTKYLKKNKR